MWNLIRQYHMRLLVIGAIRIIAGQDSANRYMDRIDVQGREGGDADTSDNASTLSSPDAVASADTSSRT